jgi:hypothetical protein
MKPHHYHLPKPCQISPKAKILRPSPKSRRLSCKMQSMSYAPPPELKVIPYPTEAEDKDLLKTDRFNAVINLQ